MDRDRAGLRDPHPAQSAKRGQAEDPGNLNVDRRNMERFIREREQNDIVRVDAPQREVFRNRQLKSVLLAG